MERGKKEGRLEKEKDSRKLERQKEERKLEQEKDGKRLERKLYTDVRKEKGKKGMGGREMGK